LCRTIRPGAVRLPSGAFVSTHTPGPTSSYCEYAPAPVCSLLPPIGSADPQQRVRRAHERGQQRRHEEAEEMEGWGSRSEAEERRGDGLGSNGEEARAGSELSCV
jgi:hypothetical protein